MRVHDVEKIDHERLREQAAINRATDKAVRAARRSYRAEQGAPKWPSYDSITTLTKMLYTICYIQYTLHQRYAVNYMRHTMYHIIYHILYTTYVVYIKTSI